MKRRSLVAAANAALGTKRLEFLRMLVPTTTTIAALTNANNPASVMERAHVEAAAQAIGQPTQVFDAHTEDDIDRAVAAIVQQRLGALLVLPIPYS